MSFDAAEDFRWVAEQRLLILVDLARSTLQSWIKERLLEPSDRGVFSENEVLEILLVAALRELFPLAETRSLWRNLRRDGKVGEYLQLSRLLTSDQQRLDLVVEPATGRVTFAPNTRSLLAAVRDDQRPRTVHIVPMGSRILDARSGFDSFASTEPRPTTRRGRPPGRRAAVHSIRPEQ
jgi:DNA-binding transcriptional MerR regulator